MYDIYTIVWGIPYTEKLRDAIVKEIPDWAEDIDCAYDELEQYGFDFEYTGHVPDITPGYFGAVLDSDASWELDVKKIKALEPTEEQKQQVQEDFDKLPQWIKDAAEPIDIYTIWSTS